MPIIGTFLLWALIALQTAPAQDPQSPVSLRASHATRIVEDRTTLMGTDVAILIADVEESFARAAIQAGFSEIRRIEALMTDWKNSPFEAINQNAGTEPVQVSDEIIFMLEESNRISRLTNGSFDITYAGVGKLWDFRSRPPRLPDPDEIVDALKLVGFQKIRLDKQAGTVLLPLKGMRIGLGGIAKGYAVDRAVRAISALGVRNFAVNAGGDLTVKGESADGLWNVSIRHPRQKQKNIAVIPISNGAVVTSGDSERFFIHDGVRYSHIIDPQTGYPAQGSQSVTLIANHTYLGDALATGVYVMGPEKGMAFIESQPGIEGMIVGADGTVQVSSGLQGSADGERRTLQ